MKNTVAKQVQKLRGGAGRPGCECLHPLSNNRRRAIGLWNQTGAALGVSGGGGIHVTFSPTINLPSGSSGAGVDSALRASEERLIRRLEEIRRDADRRRF